MVRILQLGMSANIGGMETYLMAQYRQMDRARVQYDFLYFPEKDEDEMVFAAEVRAEGSRIYRVVQRRYAPFRHYREVASLFWKHRKEYQAVVLNTCSMDYIFPLLVAKFCSIPCRILHSHNSENGVPSSLPRRMMERMNTWISRRCVTHRWACGKMAGQWMFGKEKFTVIHNAIDLARFHYQPEVRASKREELGLGDRFVLGNVARFSYQKNHAFLIDAFAEVVKRRPDALLLLVGGVFGDSRYYKEAKAKVEAYGIRDNVRFLGMRQDTDALYQAFDVFVLPSHFEGLCISAIEAQAAGLPVVCSDALSEETRVSRTYDPQSLSLGPAAWAEAILRHRGDTRHDGADDLRTAGYDIRSEAKRVENFYASLERASLGGKGA